MNSRISLLTMSVLSAAVLPSPGGEPPSPPVDVAPPVSRWRFGADYAPLLGLKTEFSGLGTFNSPFTPQPLGGGVNYNYDNGFVRVDSSGNMGGATTNWGYQNSGQLHPAGTGSIDYSITNSLADGRADEDSWARAGFECFAYLDMGSAGFKGLDGREASWGFRAGLHYARINVDNNSTLTSGATVLTDTFDLGGTIAPLAPFSGSFAGPGPLLNDAPSRSLTSDAQAIVAGSRSLDVNLTTLALGAYLDLPVARNFDIMLEAGISAALASGTYDFHSATSIAGLGTQQSSGHDSNTDILPGVYVGLDAVYHLNASWAVQAAGRYQYMRGFELKSNGSTADLSFDSAFVVSLGVVYSF